MTALPASKRELFLILGRASLSVSQANDSSTDEVLAAAEAWRREHEKGLRQLASLAKRTLAVKRAHPTLNTAAERFFSPVVQGDFDDVLQSAEGYLNKLIDTVMVDLEAGAESCEKNFRAMLVLFSSLDKPL